MEVLLQGQVFTAGIERGVELRELLQRRGAGLDQEGEHGQLDAGLLVLLVQRHAQAFQVGDVGLLELGDVRDHRPVAGQVRTRDLLDARQRLDFGLAELAEVDLRPRQQVQATTGSNSSTAGSRHATAECGLDELLHVTLGDAATLLGAVDLQQVHAQFAGEHTHRRGGIRHLGRQHAIGVELHRRAGRGTGRGDLAGRQPVRLRRHSDRLDLGGGLGGSRSGGGGSLGRRRCASALGFDDGDHIALRQIVANLDLDLLDHTGHRRRHFHGGLVAFQRDQALVLLDRVADGDQHFDDRDTGVIADIRHQRLHRATAGGRGSSGRSRRALGSGSRGSGLGRCRSSSGRLGGFAFGHFDQRHDLAFGQAVADLDLQFLDHASHRRRHFHGRLVTFQRHQALVLLDRVADGDKHLDYRDIAVVTDIGDKCFLDFGHGDNSGNLV